MCGVGACGSLVLSLAVALAPAGALAQQETPDQELTPQQRRVTVLPELAEHRGLAQLDLEFCGSGSEAQISRGPLGCGFPVVGDHPWLVVLGFKTPRGKISFKCSGALISDRFVVTSARCALGTPFVSLKTVRAGEYNMSATVDCLWYAPDVCIKPQEHGVLDVLVHPNFTAFDRGEPNLYDIAVVKLAAPLTNGFGVMPICLPMFPRRPPPQKRFALSMGLNTAAPTAGGDGDGGAACCSCSRDRNTTTHVMDDLRMADVNATYEGAEPCQYRLLADDGLGARRCLAAGVPCMADLGAPLVSVDRFGAAFYLSGVASVVPSRVECQAGRGTTVEYLPVQPHVRWLLDAVDCLASGDRHCVQA